MKYLKGLTCAFLMGLGSLLWAGNAFAQGAPTLPAIEFPIDTASIVAAIVTAGGLLLVLIIGPRTGFALIKMLAAKLTKAVRG